MYVACANTNEIYALRGGRTVEKINLALTPRQPAGMTPSALALSADGRFLFVACSDANAVAVIDVSGANGEVKGFVPAGWYPTSVPICNMWPTYKTVLYRLWTRSMQTS